MTSKVLIIGYNMHVPVATGDRESDTMLNAGRAVLPLVKLNQKIVTLVAESGPNI